MVNQKLSHIMSLDGMKCFFFGKEKKNIFVSSEKVSTFLNAFSAWKFCNNPIQVEEENGIAVGLICFLKIVCQNEKYLKSQINSLVNMSNKNGQFFETSFLCLFMSTVRQKSELGYNNNTCQSTYQLFSKPHFFDGQLQIFLNIFTTICLHF